MSYAVKVCGVAEQVTAERLRAVFRGLTIPSGHVIMIGGDDGIAYVAFDKLDDKETALSISGRFLEGSQIFISDYDIIEMMRVKQEAAFLHKNICETTDSPKQAEPKPNDSESFSKSSERDERHKKHKKSKKSRERSESRERKSSRGSKRIRRSASRSEDVTHSDSPPSVVLQHDAKAQTQDHQTTGPRRPNPFDVKRNFGPGLPRPNANFPRQHRPRHTRPPFANNRGRGGRFLRPRMPFGSAPMRPRGPLLGVPPCMPTPQMMTVPPPMGGSLLMSDVPRELREGDIAKLLYDSFIPVGKIEVQRTEYYGPKQSFRIDFMLDWDCSRCLELRHYLPFPINRCAKGPSQQVQPVPSPPFQPMGIPSQDIQPWPRAFPAPPPRATMPGTHRPGGRIFYPQNEQWRNRSMERRDRSQNEKSPGQENDGFKCTVVIENLHTSVSDKELYNYLKPVVGDRAVNVTLEKCSATKEGKQIIKGVVRLGDAELSDKLVEQLNGSLFYGRKIMLKRGA